MSEDKASHEVMQDMEVISLQLQSGDYISLFYQSWTRHHLSPLCVYLTHALITTTPLSRYTAAGNSFAPPPTPNLEFSVSHWSHSRVTKRVSMLLSPV